MEQMRQPLVIFDCDGVLVDSEPLSIRVLIDAVKANGGELGEQQAYQRFLGRSMAHMVSVLDADFGIHADAAFLERMRQDLYRSFEADLQPIAGIADALSAMPWRRCVASSSQPERIRLSLGLTGLLGFLEPHVYSATMVANGKPAPDLFLHAAREMGADPADCIVIEDSPAGILAAQRAGMAVFAFTGGSHADREEYRTEIAALSPDVVFDAMPDLLHLIANYISDPAGRPTVAAP
ncbi:haloacid dehalogenase superfamily, subfamily IA, variant 3 with third motif having DD or ED [Rhizobium sp. RU35A]|uniref:HAD family hydrolase n=1 Tax=Rhizobium sp. RU35A TaxID=1907414 RepID=UPI000954E6A9|nr:HAD family hydrolase [Rhizobium sp. RU35A]SIQ13285.1 haloacid dehalogenase superfamily, subfamily IA, variant 3 with third motif having DD or ED [Rhizobium sp. RU35A]